jgi:hypothetical protein
MQDTGSVEAVGHHESVVERCYGVDGVADEEDRVGGCVVEVAFIAPVRFGVPGCAGELDGGPIVPTGYKSIERPRQRNMDIFFGDVPVLADEAALGHDLLGVVAVFLRSLYVRAVEVYRPCATDSEGTR